VDKNEAQAILSDHLAEYRKRTYAKLLPLLEQPETAEIIADSGAWYQLEFQAVWDDRSKQTLRVIGSIDDGGFRAFLPLSDDFIVAADGTFIGE
jgi:hypothetical protein